MKKDQEARILDNQVLIMRALLFICEGTVDDTTRQFLKFQIKDIETFMRDSL